MALFDKTKELHVIELLINVFQVAEYYVRKMEDKMYCSSLLNRVSLSLVNKNLLIICEMFSIVLTRGSYSKAYIIFQYMLAYSSYNVVVCIDSECFQYELYWLLCYGFMSGWISSVI